MGVRVCDDVKQGHVAIDEDFIAIQEYVDQGRNPWRLYPVNTAKMVGIANLGFSERDQFDFKGYYQDYESGRWHALLWVFHDSCKFLVELYQPVKQRFGGIWAVQRVTLLSS